MEGGLPFVLGVLVCRYEALVEIVISVGIDLDRIKRFLRTDTTQLGVYAGPWVPHRRGLLLDRRRAVRAEAGTDPGGRFHQDILKRRDGTIEDAHGVAKTRKPLAFVAGPGRQDDVPHPSTSFDAVNSANALLDARRLEGEVIVHDGRAQSLEIEALLGCRV